MKHEIRDEKGFRVVGKGIRITITDGNQTPKISEFWEQSMSNGVFETVNSIAEDGLILGVCADFNPEDQSFTYFIAAKYSLGASPVGLEAIEIPAYTWAVFEVVGLVQESFPKAFSHIHSEFLPSSGYVHANAPDLEVYLSGDMSSPDYVCEIWIPVVKSA
jgi:AraC family transcriptional regulator